ncbi:hypothetical protein TSUD_210390 [Trifolium subterraneum]|uniref:F-box domain-containing protein n=1 Tax=Trifolium subterraneum TaxID=3900 RepID=A0A2Z6NW88_TRISU|nr:hypothetical protein TSUD_210390 [Trifolium subterraneum]
MARRRQCKRQRKDKNKNEDIISDLTDSVLIHILSFLNAKPAVQTSILSKRWRFLWRSLPTLEISYSHFSTNQRVDDFVSQILSLHDDSMAIHTLNFENCHYLDFSILQRAITYAVSHNLQHLLVKNTFNIKYFPSCIFSCHTLTYVDLSGFLFNSIIPDSPKQIFPNSLNWPALTSLSLKYFAFAPSDDDGCVDPFSSLETSSLLLTWLVELANIESLTFFSNTFEVLSSVPDLLKVELHSLSVPIYHEAKRRKKEKVGASNVKHDSDNIVDLQSQLQRYMAAVVLDMQENSAVIVLANEINANELQCVEGALNTLLIEGTNGENLKATRERLEALENVIESVENGLENLFRRLIKSRASLLNVISQ